MNFKNYTNSIKPDSKNLRNDVVADYMTDLFSVLVRMSYAFTGGVIKQIMLDVSGYPCVHLEKEVIGMKKREYSKMRID